MAIVQIRLAVFPEDNLGGHTPGRVDAPGATGALTLGIRGRCTDTLQECTTFWPYHPPRHVQGTPPVFVYAYGRWRLRGGTSFESIASEAANVVSHTDSTADPDPTCEYRVRASNSVGTSASDVASVTTPSSVELAVPTLPVGFLIAASALFVLVVYRLRAR